MKLNIMGCSVTASGTSTLHMQWDHVEARKKKDWFGIWPKDRAADRRFIDEYVSRAARPRSLSVASAVCAAPAARHSHAPPSCSLRPLHSSPFDCSFTRRYGKVWDAAIKIQNACRTKRSRRDMAIKREMALQKWVAETLQSFWRGRQGRREAIIRGMQRNVELEAAIRLQGCYRRRKAALDVALRRQSAEDARRVHYATAIQSRLRGRNARRLADRLWEEREAYLDACERLALKLQSSWRGRCGRVAVTMAKAAAAALAIESEKAASKMQQIYRGRLARQNARSRKRALKDDGRRREEAAIVLQCAYRGRSSQKNMWAKQLAIATLNKSVVMVQSAWRSKQGRFAGFLLAKAKEDAEADVAARSLQKMFRHHKATKMAKLTAMFRKDREQIVDWAVRKLQGTYRGKLGRDFAKSQKKRTKKAAFEGLRLEEWASITMQRAWRGYLGRTRAAEHERKMAESWKEMWDEEKKRFFFYNMRTGEIRWRKPQILLDMVEQPVCDNCSYYSATMECHFCGEFFCQEVRVLVCALDAWRVAALPTRAPSLLLYAPSRSHPPLGSTRSSLAFLSSPLLFSSSALPPSTTAGSGRNTNSARSSTSTASASITATGSFPRSGRRKSSRTSTPAGSFAKRRMARSTTRASRRGRRIAPTLPSPRQAGQTIGSSTSMQSSAATFSTTPTRTSRASIGLLASSRRASPRRRRSLRCAGTGRSPRCDVGGININRAWW